MIITIYWRLYFFIYLFHTLYDNHYLLFNHCLNNALFIFYFFIYLHISITYPHPTAPPKKKERKKKKKKKLFCSVGETKIWSHSDVGGSMSLHIFNCIYIDGFVAVWKQKPAVASQRYVFVSAVTCLILNLHTAILVSYRTLFLK